jgi:hypothetical protein
MKKLLLVLGLWCVAQAAHAQVGLYIRPNSSSLSSPVTGQTWLFNSTNYTTSCWNGSAFQLTSAPLNNFSATLAPTTGNDNTEGYSQGSEWYNTSNGYVYICVSAATSAAVWVQINNLGSLSIPLNNLQSGGASTGQQLIYNGTHWAPGAGTVAVSNITQSGASTGQVITWNGSIWAPASLGSFSISLSSLQQSGATTGDTTQWNGTNWVAVNPLALNPGGTDNQIYTQSTGDPGWGYGWMTVNSQTYFSGTNDVQNSDPTFIYADSSSGTNTLNLPAANLVLGKIYMFVPINFDNPIVIQVFAGDSILAYGSSTQVTTLTLDPASANAYPLILTSDGGSPGQWIQVTPIAPVLVYQQTGNFTPTGNTSQYVDTTSGNITCTLPDATELTGQSIKVIYTAGTNTINFATTSSQTINGSSPSQTLTTVGSLYIFESDGSDWWITGHL